MSARILLLSGPNLDLLGSRRPEIYGSDTLDVIVERFRAVAATFGATVRHHQTNFEGALVESLHDARDNADAVVINPGALTHYSWSLRDALETFAGVTIEVHLSNPAARDSFRQRSTIAGVVSGTIAGFGSRGYDLAAYAVRDLLGGPAGAAT